MYIYIACGVYIILLIVLVEWVYYCRYLPNLRRAAQNGYIDL
jgi:hypothetical protein